MMNRSRRQEGRTWGTFSTLLVLLSPLTAWAQTDDVPAPLEARLELTDRDVVTTSFDITSAFTDRFRKKLGGGLKSHVVIEMYLMDANDEVIAANVRECRMRLDIWDDVLTVAFREADRRGGQRFLVIDKGLRACGDVQDASLGKISLMRLSTGYELKVVVTLNPVSEELLQSTRDFLSNPRGTRPGGQRTLFGAVSKFFSQDSAAGEEQFVFASRRLRRPSHRRASP